MTPSGISQGFAAASTRSFSLARGGARGRARSRCVPAHGCPGATEAGRAEAGADKKITACFATGSEACKGPTTIFAAVPGKKPMQHDLRAMRSISPAPIPIERHGSSTSISSTTSPGASRRRSTPSTQDQRTGPAATAIVDPGLSVRTTRCWRERSPGGTCRSRRADAPPAREPPDRRRPAQGRGGRGPA